MSTTGSVDLGKHGRSGAPDTEEIAEQQSIAARGKAKHLLRKILVPIFKPSPTRIFPNTWRALLAQPAIFEVWYRTRAWRLLLTHGMKSLDPTAMDEAGGFLHKVASYNKSQIWEWHRMRTEKLTAALRCIDELPPRPRILVIGPRNEAELLLLNLYRFPFKDIESIDIFSYSPLIKLQDMHDIKFPDNSFDVVYSAWTLRYAYDIKKAASELVRVLKPGGLVVTGYSHTPGLVTSADGAPLMGGLKELHGYFEPHIDWIYWQEVLPTPEQGSNEITTIFRIKKPVTTASAE